MNNFYIYSFKYKKEKKDTSATVIFCDRNEIDRKDLIESIKEFHKYNYQTNEIYVLASNCIKQETLKEIFYDQIETTFKGIPKLHKESLIDNLFIMTFDSIGKLTFYEGKKIPEEFEKIYINQGLQNIFLERGGIVASEGGHHYVFPSGKHAKKFLRVANILLNSSEIYFIAFSLLSIFSKDNFEQIYCDTSSINSIVLAMLELKNRLEQDPSKRKQIPIKSFGSYEGLLKNGIQGKKNNLVLVSASTSGSIIGSIKNVKEENIIFLFFLGKKGDYKNISEQVLCNLTKEENTNPNGVDVFETYSNESECEFCKKGSYPVEIKGDIFSLEKPKINKIVFKIDDPEENLSNFMEQFRTKKDINVLKVQFNDKDSESDNYENHYEVFIDYKSILENIDNYDSYKNKLNLFINKYIPSNTKYIITLEDSASKKLSEYIRDKIKDNYNEGKVPNIINLNDVNEKNIPEASEGSAIVVASCVANGKNLLYISRALRKHENLGLVYFIGITRTKNKEHLHFLKSNLKQRKIDSNTFVQIENIYCADHNKKSPWTEEKVFINKIIEFIDIYNNFSKAKSFLVKRKENLENNIENNKGMTNEIFYPWFTNDEQELKINKNFAFFKFDNYVDDVSQSDIYFTISSIINTLRNRVPNENNNSNKKENNTLKQEVFVRNLISPANFNRFNDGIIQASVLRAASPEELAYSIDYDLSMEMTITLETMIRYYSNEQGEALAEFLYAIAIKKLTLKREHLERIIQIIDNSKKNPDIIYCFSKYIQFTNLNKEQQETLKYLKDNKTVDVNKYQNINKCSEYKANIDLNDLVEKKFLLNKQDNDSLFYELNI